MVLHYALVFMREIVFSVRVNATVTSLLTTCQTLLASSWLKKKENLLNEPFIFEIHPENNTSPN